MPGIGRIRSSDPATAMTERVWLVLNVRRRFGFPCPTECDVEAHPEGKARDVRKPVMGRVGKLRLLAILIAVFVTGSGCSMLIASRGVASVPTFTTEWTRQEVRHTLGDPESSETRSDGIRVEPYRIRRKVESPWEDMFRGGRSPVQGDARAAALLIALSPMFEVLFTVGAIYESEKQKYEVTLVYGPDDRLLYFYDMNATPAERFAAARRPLRESLWKQLENDERPKWAACLTAYAAELHRRAALAGYTLPAKEEENLQQLIDVARAKDEGRMTTAEALEALRASCLLKC